MGGSAETCRRAMKKNTDVLVTQHLPMESVDSSVFCYHVLNTTRHLFFNAPYVALHHGAIRAIGAGTTAISGLSLARLDCHWSSFSHPRPCEVADAWVPAVRSFGRAEGRERRWRISDRVGGGREGGGGGRSVGR